MQPPRGIDVVPLGAPSRSRPGLAWAFLSLVAVVAVVTMGVLFLQRENLSARAEAAEQRLSDVRGALAASRASLDNLRGQLERMREDLVVTVRSVDRCRAGLRAIVKLWNQHTQELDAARQGSASALAAAHRRTEAARTQAQRALRRCA
jgi:chromosome segregation ATPase